MAAGLRFSSSTAMRRARWRAASAGKSQPYLRPREGRGCRPARATPSALPRPASELQGARQHGSPASRLRSGRKAEASARNSGLSDGVPPDAGTTRRMSKTCAVCAEAMELRREDGRRGFGREARQEFAPTSAPSVLAAMLMAGDDGAPLLPPEDRLWRAGGCSASLDRPCPSPARKRGRHRHEIEEEDLQREERQRQPDEDGKPTTRILGKVAGEEVGREPPEFPKMIRPRARRERWWRRHHRAGPCRPPRAQPGCRAGPWRRRCRLSSAPARR